MYGISEVLHENTVRETRGIVSRFSRVVAPSKTSAFQHLPGRWPALMAEELRWEGM
jgi:hypothetical protein